MKKLTPILIVDQIEAVLPFWLSIGFEQKMGLPDGDGLGFAILESTATGPLELMLQTRSLVGKDIPALAEHDYRSALYIEVESLDVIEKSIENIVEPTSRIFERRTTFYGSTEIAVYDPAGNVITFAQFG